MSAPACHRTAARRPCPLGIDCRPARTRRGVSDRWRSAQGHRSAVLGCSGARLSAAPAPWRPSSDGDFRSLRSLLECCCLPASPPVVVAAARRYCSSSSSPLSHPLRCAASALIADVSAEEVRWPRDKRRTAPRCVRDVGLLLLAVWLVWRPRSRFALDCGGQSPTTGRASRRDESAR